MLKTNSKMRKKARIINVINDWKSLEFKSEKQLQVCNF